VELALVSGGETLRIDFGHFSRAAPLTTIASDLVNGSGVDVKKSLVPVANTRRQPSLVEWLNVMAFLYGWAAREHYLNLQALRLVPVETHWRDAHRIATTSRAR
jgi:hypothetical protein